MEPFQKPSGFPLSPDEIRRNARIEKNFLEEQPQTKYIELPEPHVTPPQRVRSEKTAILFLLGVILLFVAFVVNLNINTTHKEAIAHADNISRFNGMISGNYHQPPTPPPDRTLVYLIGSFGVLSIVLGVVVIER